MAQSLARVFHQQVKGSEPLAVYELSSRGAFVRMLNQTPHHVTLSEYFPDTAIGTIIDGVQCQDVQNLSFPDEYFDVCTSLEVFEHVENDLQGFAEIFRVLKPGGFTVFTVPIDLNQKTIERTAWVDGQRQCILPPEYHSDKLRGNQRVFCYRNYGYDIINRLKQVGFKKVEIIQSSPNNLLGYGRPVIYAKK